MPRDVVATVGIVFVRHGQTGRSGKGRLPTGSLLGPVRRGNNGIRAPTQAGVEASAPAAFGGIIPVPSPSRGPLSPAPGMSGDVRTPASRRGPAEPPEAPVSGSGTCVQVHPVDKTD